jgi:NAD(P)-dependent dehydrogenase (short-subunit alcohol dehydrogenase family)
MFETNFFGAVALIRAVLPLMRQQKSGAIIQNSSVHGSTTTAGYGAYSASKCALDGLFEALYEEVKPFGIHAMLVKPGAFRTDVLSPGGNVTYTDSIGVYDEEQTKHRHASLHGQQPGDPRRAAAATDKALHSKDPPLWLLLGNDCVDAVTGALHKQLQEIKRWETLSRSTDFPPEK